MTSYYAALAGTPSNDGSLLKPWDLSTALKSALKPGDTLYVRGGTYSGAFNSSLNGSLGLSITVQSFPGEWAVIDGAPIPGGGPAILAVRGSWTRFQKFEIINTNPSRTSPDTTHDHRPNVVFNVGNHNTYRRLSVHDGGVAFYQDAVYGDTLIEHCDIYNNGWQGPDRGHGHGVYMKSLNGPVTVRKNRIYRQYGYGIHGYSDAGSGQLNNMLIEDNVIFDNADTNLLLGGGDPSTGCVIRRNTCYMPNATRPNVVVGFGSTKNGTVSVIQNRVLGGLGLDIKTQLWSVVVNDRNDVIPWAAR